MKRKSLMGLVSLMMLLFLAGCGKVPQDKIDAAKAAIETLRAAEADVYVPEEFANLENQMKTIMAIIEAENSKTFKNFKEQIVQLENIVASTGGIIENANEAKEVVLGETEGLFEQIKTVLAENKDLMAKAPKGKEGAAVLEEMRNEIAIIETSVAEAHSMFENGNYKAASDKVKAAIEGVQSINTELQEAIAKIKRK